MALPNDLAADGSGNLYAADSGMPFMPGAIRKITLASAHAIATQTAPPGGIAVLASRK